MTTTPKKILTFLILVLLLTTLTVSQNTDIPAQDQHSDQHPQHEQETNLITLSQRWGFGFLAGLGVSLIGFGTALVIVCCKNCASDACFQITIKFLFSLAFGALLGDAMIHILPAAYKSQKGDFRIVSAIFIGAVIFFLILERLFESCGVTHKHWHNDECHDDHEGAIKHHNHPKKVFSEEESRKNFENSIKVEEIKSNNLILDQNECNNNKCQKQSEHVHDHGLDHNQDSRKEGENEENKSCWENLKGKGSAGYMNLLGSLIHNFMDGLALGVAFATGDKKIFVPVLVAIIAHEIPREMGDVAILMTNSFNPVQTVLCNGFVNLVSLVGLFIGLGIANLDEMAQSYVLVFVAGNFIFIAADIWRNLFKNPGLGRNLLEFFGFAVGVAAMYLILLLETQESGHDH